MRGRTSSRALVARQLAGLLLLAMLGAATHAQVAWEPGPWEPLPWRADKEKENEG